jgi:hypothetical protein
MVCAQMEGSWLFEVLFAPLKVWVRSDCQICRLHKVLQCVFSQAIRMRMTDLHVGRSAARSSVCACKCQSGRPTVDDT